MTDAEIEESQTLTQAEISRQIDELYRGRIRDARGMPAEEKLLAGEELFEYACSITLAGIRNQFPEATEEDRVRILQERLDLRERMENGG